MKEVKCEHCGFWTDGHQSHCQFCGQRLNAAHFEEKEKRAKEEFRGIPFIKIPPNAPFYVKGFRYVILFFQLVFASIISLVAAMASGTVH